MNLDKIRKDFPILNKLVGGKPVVYFDNSCMTLRPTQVIDAMNQYYTDYPSCALRSHHKLSQMATEKVHEGRRIVRKFIGAKNDNEIIFTRNTSEGINLVANCFGLKKEDTVITTDKEHNSNNIPWIKLKNEVGIHRKIVKSNFDNTFSLENFENELDKNVKLVSVVHTSNMDGVTTPIKEVIKLAHDYGAKVLIDAAQSAPHKELNVKRLDADFLAFSGHKMLGPSGLGILYGKEFELNSLAQYNVGGETVKDSTYDSYEVEELPGKFEAGLQDYAGIIGMGAAAKYLDKIGMNNISKHESKLNAHLTNQMQQFEGLKILGPLAAEKRGGIFSFNINGHDPHDIALMSDSLSNVMLRSGAHCVHSWFNAHKMAGSARASMYLYNTIEEIDIFVKTLKEITGLKN